LIALALTAIALFAVYGLATGSIEI
jgi:hypothetical protein